MRRIRSGLDLVLRHHSIYQHFRCPVDHHGNDDSDQWNRRTGGQQEDRVQRRARAKYKGELEPIHLVVVAGDHLHIGEGVQHLLRDWDRHGWPDQQTDVDSVKHPSLLLSLQEA